MERTNREKIKALVNGISNENYSSLEQITAYMASIATSLAVIADVMEEKNNDNKNNIQG